MIKISLMSAKLASLALLQTPAADTSPNADGADLQLICEGEKITSIATDSTTAGVVSSNGFSAVGSSVTTQPTKIPMTIQLRLRNGDGEININAKWSKIKNLVVSDEEISGAIGSMWLGTRQHFSINRGTGRITTDGTFHGDCRKLVDQPKKF